MSYLTIPAICKNINCKPSADYYSVYACVHTHMHIYKSWLLGIDSYGCKQVVAHKKEIIVAQRQAITSTPAYL